MDKTIIFVGRTFSGRNHDYKMLKEEFPPEQGWFEGLSVFVDLGYQGIQREYEGEEIQLPYKKPRKSKKNPTPQLTSSQKAYNRAISKIRIYVENAIGGMKRYNILVHPFRNHHPSLLKKGLGFEDDVLNLTAGLWNFLLLY